MNITFQTMNTSYRSPVPAQRRYTSKAGKAKADYDKVDIDMSRASQGADESFARILARKAASQLGGVSQERIRELSNQVAEGSYLPDAHKIAGRLLGLG